MTPTPPVKLALHAMATRFELIIYGDDPAWLRPAGEEALHEIELLDAQLSLFRSGSDISRVNALASTQPVKLEPRLFELIKRAVELSALTDGAFDITISPLMHAWGHRGGEAHVPSEDHLNAALDRVGAQHVLLHELDHTVRFDRQGMQIDLGAIGKGYAIERAVEVLRDCGVVSALIHGGTSTIYGIGSPPDVQCWRVGIYDPVSQKMLPETIDLHDSSLSVSAVHGRSCTIDGKQYGHVIDPRSGSPTSAALLAAVWGPSPTETDALSTALLVLGEPGVEMIQQKMPGYGGLVVR